MTSIRAIVDRFGRRARAVRLAADVGSLVAGTAAALWLRNLDGDVAYNAGRIAAFTIGLVLTFGLVGLAEGLYRGRSRYGSFDEVASLMRTTAVTTPVAVVLARLPHPLV